MSAFILQIVDAEGNLATTFFPGSPAEVDFGKAVADLAAAKVRAGGYFRTEAKVRDAVRRAIEEVIFDLKKSVVPR